jgi:hypothetical protein
MADHEHDEGDEGSQDQDGADCDAEELLISAVQKYPIIFDQACKEFSF